MTAVRIILGFVAAVAVAYVLSAASLTQQTLSHYPGLEPDLATYLSTFGMNVLGLAQGSPFVGILGAAMAIAFMVAALLKRALRPLAPIAYVIAGAVGVPALFVLVENVMLGGGVGAFFGARDAAGMALQAVSGAVGGLVFTLIAVRK
jgi:hypothetical protein